MKKKNTSPKHKPENNHGQSNGSSRHNLQLLILAFLTLLVFSPLLQQDFLNYDDDWMIFENPHVVHFSGESIRVLFTDFYKGQYSPLAMTISGAIYQLGAGSAFAFKLGSLLIHLLNTLLVYLLLKTLFRDHRTGLVAAAFFALHPVQAESVAWLSASYKMGIFALFSLAALWYWLSYTREHKTMHLAISLLMMILAALSKEQAIILPLLMLSVSWFEKKNLLSRKTWLPLLPFFLISLLLTLTTYLAVSSGMDIKTHEFSFLQRIFLLGYSFVSYLRLLLWPLNLAPLYGFPQAGAAAWLIYPLLGILALYLMWRASRNDRRVKWALVFFLLSLILSFSLQLVSIRDTLYADRYLYLGVPVFFGALFLGLEKVAGKNISWLFLIMILVASGISFQKAKVYKNSETFWSDAINGPYVNALAYTNRGRQYRLSNQIPRAMADYNKALELDPDFYLALNNRGKILFDQGQHDAAMRDFQKALDIMPDYPPALNNRGVWFASRHELKKALDDFNRALQLDPYYTDAYANRALAHFYLRDYKMAISDTDDFLKFKPADASMVNLRALCHRNLGDLPMALLDFDQAIELDPTDGRYYQNRSFLHYAMENYQQAWLDIQQAMALGIPANPSYIKPLSDKLEQNLTLN